MRLWYDEYDLFPNWFSELIYTVKTNFHMKLIYQELYNIMHL